MDDCDTGINQLISCDEALKRLVDSAEVLQNTEKIEVIDGLNRVLAKPVLSAINVPPADNASVDGYAVCSADTTDINTMEISQRIPAGSSGTPLQHRTVARIFTGAPLPEGADAVVMQEYVEVAGNSVSFSGPIKADMNVRIAGEDIKADSTILESGTRLRAQEMGLAASAGVRTLTVYQKPKVAIFMTGDELVEPGRTLKPGQIYDSNRYTLYGLLQKTGCEIVSVSLVRDNLEDTRNILQQCSEKANLIISSGGVSVGEEDYVRTALEESGHLEMWSIAIKPGKPLTYGHIGTVPFLGLPGNPVSVYVTFLWMVIPFIRLMQGQTYMPPVPVKASADFEWLKPGIRREYARARMELVGNEQSVKLYPNQGSGVLSSACWANGLVEIPENRTVQKGDRVSFWHFETLL